jgi:NitT/TauT family transport system permease protein
MHSGRALDFLLPIGTAIVLILVWEFCVRWFAIPTYLLPPPSSVLIALDRGLIDGVLWPHILATTSEFLSGYVVGCTAALSFAVLVSEFRFIERAVYPVIVALQSVPKVALAPLIIVWFGFDIQSKVVMVALICFFPTFVSSVVALKGCDPNLIDLYRAFGASRARILLEVKLPSALGGIFAGLEISVVLALLGAIVAEFVAARRGLGYTIQASSVEFNVAMMFACVVILSVMGVTASQIIKFAHRRIAFWERRASAGQVSQIV